MPTSNQKTIAALKKQVAVLTEENRKLNISMTHIARASEGCLDAFLELRQAVDDEGYEILVNGEVKPIHTHDELCLQIKKYF